MIWTILSIIFVFSSIFAAYISAKNSNNKAKDNYIAHWIYTFSNLYNCIYFFSTMDIIKTQAVYAIRNILFFIIAITGVRTYSKQLKQRKENESNDNNS